MGECNYEAMRIVLCMLRGKRSTKSGRNNAWNAANKFLALIRGLGLELGGECVLHVEQNYVRGNSTHAIFVRWDVYMWWTSKTGTKT